MFCLTALILGNTLARAGSYAVSFSGGSYETYGEGTQPDYDDGGGDYSAGPAASIQSTFTVTCTWVPDGAGDTPPQTVILDETGYAYWEAQGGTTTAGGSCSDGLGDPAVPNTDSLPYLTSGSPQSANDHYSPHKGGNSFTYTRTPTVSSGGDNQGTMIYSVGVSPVTITPGGATSDGSGGWDILIGQKCQPTLMAAGSLSNYQWSVSGTTFQTWQPTTPAIPPYNAKPNASHYVGGPGPMNGPDSQSSPPVPAPSWYWNDLSQTTETITCTATVTPPTGDGSPFPVTASQQVTVIVPSVDATGIGGYMKIVPAYFIQASPANSKTRGGMEFDASVVNPPYTAFGSGQIEMVQIAIPNESYINFSDGIVHSDPENYQVGLDTGYPYGVTAQNPNGGAVGPDTRFWGTQDSPRLLLQRGNTPIASSVQMTHQFQDTIMYQPANSSQWVPLAIFSWSTNGGATIPSTNNWANYPSPLGAALPSQAGTVSPSGSAEFTPSNFFPSWGVINVFPAF